MDGSYMPLAIVSIVASLIDLALMITLIVIAASAVRSVDRSAAGIFVASAGVSIVALIASVGLGFLMSAMDTDAIETFLILKSILLSVLGITAYALIVGGVARLAKAKRHEPRE